MSNLEQLTDRDQHGDLIRLIGCCVETRIGGFWFGETFISREEAVAKFYSIPREPYAN